MLRYIFGGAESGTMGSSDGSLETDHGSLFGRFTPNFTVLGFSGKQLLVLGGVLLVAINLRPAIASVSPVLEQLRSDLGLGYAAASLLTTIPTFCMGLFAFATPRLTRSLGRERTVFWTIVCIGVATFSRLWSVHVAVLFMTTIVVGIGVAVGQALLPELVSEYFTDRAGFATGLYTTCLILGGGIATSLTAPLANTLGSWPAALAVWAVLAVIALLVWIPVMGVTRSTPVTETSVADQISWRHPWAWAIALFFAGQTILFYSLLTWLAPLYVDLGWSSEQAGFLLTVAMGGQLTGSLCVTAFVDRFPDRRPIFAVALTSCAVAFTAIALVPLAAPWFCAALLGFGAACSFALGMTLPVDYAPTPDTAGQLSSIVLGIGYLIGALGPLAVGWMRGLTGGYRIPFLGLAVVSILMLVGTMRFRPDRTIGTN
jgi:CP family cyanate transporter-like MFS transporter